jgi:hypothetical protein
MPKIHACWEGMIEVGSSPENMLPYKNAKGWTMSVNDGNITWIPIGGDGWEEAFKTSKGMTLGVTAIKTDGDPASEFISSHLWTNGEDAYVYVRINFPSGLKVLMKAVITVKNDGAGEGGDAEPQEVEFKSCGKPEVTKAEATE